MLIKFPSGNIFTAEEPTGIHSSNYNVETQATVQSVTMIKDEKEVCQQVVFLSGARSVQQALEGNELPHLVEGIQEVRKTNRSTVDFITL